MLEHYVMHKDEAQQVGEAGYWYVLNHHMMRDSGAFFLNKIDSKLDLD